MASATGAPASGEPAPATGSPVRRRRAVEQDVLGFIKRFLTLREGSIIVVTVLVAIYFALSTETFFTTDNFKTLLPYFAPFAILAAGEVFLMINGEIDLSIGAVYLFTPFLFYELHNGGVPLLPGVIIALIAAAGVGVINGFFTAIVGVNSFITTLGTLFALEGLTLIISHAQPVATPGAQVTSTTVNVQHVVNGHHIVLPETVNHISTFARVFGGGTYSELIWALVIVAVLQVLLSRTRWGLYTVAVGSNRLGAREAGVRVRLVVIRNFILCSACAGLVGILEAVRATSVQPDTAGANAILLEAISAAVIGGTLLAGGSGTVVGALIGALFLGILHDGLVLKGVNANYLALYLGLAIILAMVINTYVARVRTGSGLG
ncbi:MAG: ABC transporter permease [Solirubrobacteraceae bacterium]